MALSSQATALGPLTKRQQKKRKKAIQKAFQQRKEKRSE